MQADLWQRGCERLAAELPDQQFNTWIRPLPQAEVSDDGPGAVVTVRVPNRFKLDWIRNQYADRIESVLSELAGKPVRLDVALPARESPAAPAPQRLASTAAATEPRSAAAASASAATYPPQPSRSRLNAGLTFD
ncbi:MAG: chromosomal replication initiator protein DnaA, partial [Pseudomonadota bacterium]|nr:chromosomal replication initiator protein DnaA [Pseudomonadota bacterium]